MKKDYNSIKQMHTKAIEEQLNKESKAIKKFKCEELFQTHFIIIYDNYYEMYSINNCNEISNINRYDDVDKLDIDTIKELNYREY